MKKTSKVVGTLDGEDAGSIAVVRVKRRERRISAGRAMKFHNREYVLIALAVGGLIAFAKEIVTGVGVLYRLALTPQGLAMLMVATMLISAASLAVGLIRRS